MEPQLQEGLFEPGWTERHEFVMEEPAHSLTYTYPDEYTPADCVPQDSPSIERGPNVARTPGLVQDPGSSQTHASLTLLTPLDKPSIATDSSFHHHHAVTGISPALDRLGLGDQRELLPYYDIVGSPLGKAETGQEEHPPALFYNDNDEGGRLDHIDSDLYLLSQFPEANGPGSGLEPDSFMLSAHLLEAGPSSAFPVPFPYNGENGAPGGASTFGLSPFFLDLNTPHNVFSSEYYPTISNQHFGNVGNSPDLSREPPDSIGPTAPFERHAGDHSFLRHSPTVPKKSSGNVTDSPTSTSLHQPVSPSGIVPTAFEKHRGKGSAIHLHARDEEIAKKEGASAAVRKAANKFRKRERKYGCRICGDTLTSSQNLGNHMNSHLQVKPYQCIHCLKDYRHGRSLNRHTKKKHQSADQEQK